jgi:nicotinamide N-methyltransferase
MDVTNDYATFDPQAYLQEYYADVGAENLALLRFLVKAFCDVPVHSLTLDFGGGPTLYGAIVAAGWVDEIHLADYHESNIAQVQKWLNRDPSAFDWHPFIETTLQLEGKDVSLESVIWREEQTRRRVTRLMLCNARSSCPIDGVSQRYDVLMTNFCAEAAADDKAQWQHCMGNIVSLLRPGGRIVLSAVKGACSYAVGDTAFLAVNIQECDLRRVLLKTGFAEESIVIESVPADRPDRHYQGLMFATATKLRHDEPAASTGDDAVVLIDRRGQQ